MPRGRSRTDASGKLVLAVLRCRAKKCGRMIEIRRQRKQVLVAEPSRKIAAEAGMGVGKLQAPAYDSAHRIGDVSAHRNLQSAVKRAAGGKKHRVASHQRIDSGKAPRPVITESNQTRMLAAPPRYWPPESRPWLAKSAMLAPGTAAR